MNDVTELATKRLDTDRTREEGQEAFYTQSQDQVGDETHESVVIK